MPSGFAAFARSGFVLSGVLLLAVGVADVAIGMVKAAGYRAVLAETAPPPRRPDELFPRPTEAGQERAIAEAKLGYYELLVVVGRLLTACGVVLIGLGALRIHLQAAHPARESPGRSLTPTAR